MELGTQAGYTYMAMGEIERAIGSFKQVLIFDRKIKSQSGEIARREIARLQIIKKNRPKTYSGPIEGSSVPVTGLIEKE